MTRSRRGRWALIARGVLLLAAMLLLPLAAMLQAPRQTIAQTATQDSLWAAPQYDIGVCTDPSSSAALSGCFASAASSWPVSFSSAVATDGVNVYFASLTAGGLSCPIADLGTNCTRIMAGPWGSGKNEEVLSLAAYDGQIWIGQDTGEIYRCPANVPYVKQNTAPSQCVLLDDAGDRPVDSLMLANSTLYAGLGCYGGCGTQSKQGLLWSCDPQTANDCFTLDIYGYTTAKSLVAGGGYLWAGLDNGIIWRCDLNAMNACSNWENAGEKVVNSISYDGQGTLYAAITEKYGVIWSCPTAYANGCSNLISNVYGYSVAAGAGGVFSSTSETGLHYGTSSFTAASNSTWGNSILLYLPADGPVGVGGVSVKMSAKSLSKQFEKRCHKPGRTGRATITVTGPNDFTKTMKVGACALVKNGAMQHRVDLLDPGAYTVTVKAGKHSGKANVTIVPDRTKPVKVKLTRGTTGG